MAREIPGNEKGNHNLKDVEDLIKAGCDRIKRLDELLRDKISEEKKIKERGRTLRKIIQNDLLNFIKPSLAMEETRTDSLSTEISQNLAIIPNSTTVSPNLPRMEAVKNMERFLALCDAQEGAESKFAAIRGRCRDTLGDDSGYRNIFPTECAQCNQDESDEELSVGLAENEAIFSGSKIWTPEEEEDGEDPEAVLPEDDKEPSYLEDSWAKDFIRRNIELAGKANQLMPQTDAEKARLEELLAEDDYCTDTEWSEPVSINNSGGDLAALLGSSIVTAGNLNVEQGSNSSSGSSINQWILWPYFDGRPTDVLSGSEFSVKSVSQLSQNEFESTEPEERHHNSQTGEARTMFVRLNEIDKKLDLLAQAREEFNRSAGSGGRSTTSSDEIMDSSKSPSPVKSNGLRGPGEKVLEEAMQIRQQIHRLNEIDTRLAVMQKKDFEQQPDIQQTIIKFSNTSEKAEDAQRTSAQHPGSVNQEEISTNFPKANPPLDNERVDTKRIEEAQREARDVSREVLRYPTWRRSFPVHFTSPIVSRERRPFTTESCSTRQASQNGERMRLPWICSSAVVTRNITQLY